MSKEGLHLSGNGTTPQNGGGVMTEQEMELYEAHKQLRVNHLLTLIEEQAHRARVNNCTSNELLKKHHEKGPGLVIAGSGALEAMANGEQVPMKQGAPDYMKASERAHRTAMQNASELIRLTIELAQLTGYTEDQPSA